MRRERNRSSICQVRFYQQQLLQQIRQVAPLISSHRPRYPLANGSVVGCITELSNKDIVSAIRRPLLMNRVDRKRSKTLSKLKRRHRACVAGESQSAAVSASRPDCIFMAKFALAIASYGLIEARNLVQ